MELDIALKIEAAEREYLCSRVENLSLIKGNPYGAKIFFNKEYSCFHVEATTSPMLNRIYGSQADQLQSTANLLRQTAEYSTVTPLLGKSSTLVQQVQLTDGCLERLKGWTHSQLFCAIENVNLKRHSFDIEEVIPQKLPEFADIHVDVFHTNPNQKMLIQASFSEQILSDRMKIYAIRESGEMVAGAVMYFASNGVAYLGTAVTRKHARGLGYHTALISHRIEQAKKSGFSFIAATALPNSKSRRNLQRAGLTESHIQALYRIAAG